jgi:soluble lytic murein transglycosylase
MAIAATILAACNLPARPAFFGPTSTPRPTSTPTFTPTPTITPTPSPTPTPQPAARLQVGEKALLNGDWERALAEFDQADKLSNDPSVRAAAALGTGRTYLLSGNYKDAAKTLDALVQLYPKFERLPQSHFFLGQAYEGLKRYQDAADHYLEYLSLRPGIIDGYVLDIRGDALFAGADYPAAATDFLASLKAPTLNDVAFTRLKLARSLALSKDYATALQLYDEVYAAAANDFTKALIDLRKGQVYTALGQKDKTIEAYQDAVNNYPTSRDSYSALVALVDMGAPVDDLSRGIVDYYAGQYSAAAIAFDRYLRAKPLDPSAAWYYSGLAQRAIGNHTAAVNAWDKVIAGDPIHRFWDDAYEQKAYTQWANLDQYQPAVQTLQDFVSKAPRHPRAGEFLFDAAQVAERAGKFDQAAVLWDKVNNEYPDYELSWRALFMAGICRYRAGNYPAALQTFQRLQARSISLSERAAALFWIAKSQAANGDQTGAQAAFQQAAGADPTGYYSERALDILTNKPPFTPPVAYDFAFDPQTERARADAWVKETFKLAVVTDLSGPGPLTEEIGFRRGVELWDLGLYNEARQEFEQLRQAYKTDPTMTYRLANYLAQIGLYRSATLAARQVLDLAGMNDMTSLSAPAWLNRLRFGTYYSDLIFPAAKDYNFHPLFLFSVIRQESLFESFVRSSAAASGLMQVIPTTGDEIARELNWPADYTSDDLYRPVVSVRFGASYLNKQRKQADGDLYTALAAYNGGPGNAREWRKLAPDDPDLFLEVIRYPETRNYIRGIYENFSIYRKLYDRSP